MDTCFWEMEMLSRSQRIPYRGRLMVWNCIDLRNNRWRERKDIEKPKNIWELHRELQLSTPTVVGTQCSLVLSLHLRCVWHWRCQTEKAKIDTLQVNTTESWQSPFRSQKSEYQPNCNSFFFRLSDLSQRFIRTYLLPIVRKFLLLYCQWSSCVLQWHWNNYF